MQCTLAHKYTGQDVTGWWVSEKYDGVRAIWDGENFLSRTNKILHAPDWFKECLPDNVVLDGELWCGRGKFQETVGIVRSHLGNSNWENVKYMVFDAIVSNKTFEDRLKVLQKITLFNNAKFVGQTLCHSLYQLEMFESAILDKGGEGVMLRAPNSFYEHKRTKNLLKMKRMKHSTAVVTGHTKGKGKHFGKVGALICSWEEGQKAIITVGSGLTDAERIFPPRIGDTIKIKYFDITEAGLPRFPIFEGFLDV